MINKIDRYELNSASAKEAMLWFLLRERIRHYQDICRIDKDIEVLVADGIESPNYPPLTTFINVPGGTEP